MCVICVVVVFFLDTIESLPNICYQSSKKEQTTTKTHNMKYSFVFLLFQATGADFITEILWA